jgi:probable F420-dependent oxidoreductase
MSKLHPFRFGLFSGTGMASREEWRNYARCVESAGFSTLLMGDHQIIPLGPIAGMVAAADATTSLRVGSYMFGNDFRNPVILAQEAASVDLLSGGRLELGLGTGWYKGDYAMSGVPLDSPGARVGRLEEAVQVIKGFFGDRPFDFAGRYYSVRGLEGTPKPAQKPHPPMAIGGGSKRILSLAAREADIVSFNVRTTRDGWLDPSSTSPEAAAEKVVWVREAAGERFDELELNVLVTTVNVTDRRRDAVRDWLRDSEMPTDDANVEIWLQSPSLLIGTVDQIVEDLLARRQRYGFSYITIFEPMEPFIPVVERLAGR